MTTTIMPDVAQAASETSPRPSVLARIVAAIVAAQSRKADRRIAGHLAVLSDERLLAMGLAPAAIEMIRAGKPILTVIDRR